jgi:polyisoprenoid-binding protein YceI
MKNLNKQILTIAAMIAAVVLSTTPQNILAQTTYKAVADKDVNIKILGTSNVHDWELTSPKIDSQGDFKFDNGQLHSLTSFYFSVDAKSLKSEHESMDNRTYKTMKADQYPKVTYKLTSATITTIQKGKYLIKAKGDLTIAGVTQSILLDVNAVVNADNTITCTGSESLKLTDYKIDPPSFMLGAMKVKNDLNIKFNLLYKNN